MNGWKLASRPTITPMPRAAACRYSGSPAATAASTRVADRLPLLAARVALQPGHRQRPARGARQLLDQVELGVEALGVRAAGRSRSPSGSRHGPGPRRRSAMPHSSAALASDAGVSLPSEVRWLSLRPVLKPAAPASSASRTSARIAAMSSAPAAACWRRRARPSPPCAPGRAAPAPGSPGCAACASSASMYCGKLSQSQRMPSASAAPGMSSTPSISSISSASPARPHRREADAAVAHHHRGHAVVDAGREGLVPGGLAVVVGVDVDEARRHPGAAGVDALARRAGDAADLDDAPVPHADIGA